MNKVKTAKCIFSQLLLGFQLKRTPRTCTLEGIPTKIL